MVLCWHTKQKMKVSKGKQLTFHRALDQSVHVFFVCSLIGIICVENMLGGAGHLDYNCVPSVIYTHPVCGME